eukprot:CAMPEP_0198428240 /NCGR_PEP_ID=MMETSP1452-20131203/6417_1 /TAXON_ID=1181717 /ORGANISM="Synchroma pusillum, Strain CCMP3072" /LENGTH=408 /DNA_ID=CAMNT_0044148631 /DNA_START=89 /DNA_END=1315 /DNA_ORIENTATION=-
MAAPTPATKASLESLESTVQGRKVLVRCDLNVPQQKGDPSVITDDSRIRASLPTLRWLMERNAKVIVTSHLGRPKGAVVESMRMAPIAARLSELLEAPVAYARDIVGPEAQAAVAALQDGGVVLLENIRFDPREEANDPAFAAELAGLADMFVNDAFGTAHRAHASTAGVTEHLRPAVAGFLLKKELDFLIGAVEAPTRPFVSIVGGSKVSSKITVISALLDKVNTLILGGGMIFPFLKARGLSVGSSLVEDDQLELARSLEAQAAEKGVQIVLPTDVVLADAFKADANVQTAPVTAIPDGWMGLDIGPESVAACRAALDGAQTVLWNGPMGVFEFPAFAAGTVAIANAMAELTAAGATTIVGGGDSVAAVEQAGLTASMSHCSTGGGASLELLEGKVLPGVAALNDA